MEGDFVSDIDINPYAKEFPGDLEQLELLKVKGLINFIVTPNKHDQA